eukprot:CAMPEP_0118929578 /NCGR_PEP_ID=MMETSP1169-20130426/6535_1 /TAXON_ID=36882 /ORGANISM="Pyramimonas obovata, Strain CCMP722" /LENGTH=120 /DNA_ID=CAMNT_0006871793 /DNA_START=553 /DNA_END=912 /DNA_ORIENTATION=+
MSRCEDHKQSSTTDGVHLEQQDRPPLELLAAPTSTTHMYPQLTEGTDGFTGKEWLHAMQRANSSLEDFVRSYFMFHNLDPHCPKACFKHLPILSFVESYIYLLDERNEAQLLGSQATPYE